MINTITNSLKDILNEFGFTKKITDDEIECSIDENIVDCTEMKEEPYIGIPAPAYLEDDEWFGPAPVRTEKQLDYMVQEMEIKRQEREENFSVESDDIHQRMYEIATSSSPTTVQLNPPGGSENFQDNGWMSGKRS
jgi:hypothetical protein